MESSILVRGRAAARLRAAESLAAAERRAVREARGEVGAALRRARAGRVPAGDALILAPFPLAAAGSRVRFRRVALVVAAAAAALALVGFLPVGAEEPATAAPGGTPPAPEAVAALTREHGTSRGRSVETVTFAVVASPAPEPSPEQSAAPVAAPAGSPAPQPAAGTGGGGGSATGPGPGGNARGTSPAPSATAPAATPTLGPTPSPLPSVSPRPPGVTRFTGRVIDSRNASPIAGACVIVGVRACNERDVYTDANGRFTIDLPVGGTWDVNFGRSGYVTAYRRLVSSAPRTTDIGSVRLVALAIP